MGISSDETFQLRNCLCRITLCQLVQVVNAFLHLGRESLDIDVFERFLGVAYSGCATRVRQPTGAGGTVWGMRVVHVVEAVFLRFLAAMRLSLDA